MRIVEFLSVSEAQVVEFRELFAELNPSIVISEEKIFRALDSKGTHVFVLMDEEEHIIGSATLCVSELSTRRTAGVEAVVVSSRYRGKGFGKMLMEYVVDYARRELGSVAIHLTSNPRRVAANKLYRSLGFQKIETNVYRMEV